ncbi:putative ribosomal RNA small subunit methyltransferase B [Actinomyces sp. oral taxon 848 str. F0332]|nr:putative ribosomal RNA small subunit methyltransferase B [Actinomyces sp. oral taxon 848 str. F0332]
MNEQPHEGRNSRRIEGAARADDGDNARERHNARDGRSDRAAGNRHERRDGRRDRRPEGWHPGRQEANAARLVAFEVLRAVDEDDAYANLVLPVEIARAGLNKLDAAYATNLCYGTLRMRGRWDAIISRCAKGRRIYDIDPPVLDLLRMGCEQLLAMETPPHAAIHETVVIARNFFGQGTGGFVNAVLRRISEKAGQWPEIVRSSTASRTEFLSLWHSHPRWIVEALEESLEASGRSRDDVESVLAAHNAPAKVALVARAISPEALAERVEAAKMEAFPGYLMPNAVLLGRGDPHRLHPVRDGLAGVQDEGSQLIAALFAAAPIEGKDELWLDMCAGPGGKTATLAAIAQGRGARIHANEPQEHRLDLVAASVEPWEDTVALRLGDGRELGTQEPDAYDRVLVDAPCSGLGALRRRPEARWRKDPKDIPGLAKLQRQLLASAFKALRPGGALVYSTCSPALAETRDVVRDFLAAHGRAKLLDAGEVANRVAIRDVSARDGMVQLWADADCTDGMFIALITKEAADAEAAADSTTS